jgi:hypothetical protein
MDIKFYRYPDSISFGKMLISFLVILFFAIFLLVLIEPHYRQTNPDYYLLLITSLPFGIIGGIFYIGSFPDIGVDDDGLHVQFLWKYLKVPWKDITGVKPFGPPFLNYWVITTNDMLTLFHRIYGLYSLKSFAPSFYIFKSTKGHEFLLIKIREKVKLNSRAK